MLDHIPIRLDRSLLLGRQTSKWNVHLMCIQYTFNVYSMFKNIPIV